MVESMNVVPYDGTTNFVCSGMQIFKKRFHERDGGLDSTIQSCIRTIDIDLIGDGSHLTLFHMLGCFSFGGDKYDDSIKCWSDIVRELEIPVTHMKYHPDSDHLNIIEKNGWIGIPSYECEWSDGEIGGYCSEMFVDELEIGNMVNTMGDGVDVGFGLERMIQVIEGKNRVDETSEFDTTLPYISRDHIRTLKLLKQHGIVPGSKNRNFICRTLLRRFMKDGSYSEELSDWIKHEKNLINEKNNKIDQLWDKLPTKPMSYWKDTHGITPEDLLEYLE
jgi:alanyl-tRNA synthetase